VNDNLCNKRIHTQKMLTIILPPLVVWANAGSLVTLWPPWTVTTSIAEYSVSGSSSDTVTALRSAGMTSISVELSAFASDVTLLLTTNSVRCCTEPCKAVTAAPRHKQTTTHYPSHVSRYKFRHVDKTTSKQTYTASPFTHCTAPQITTSESTIHQKQKRHNWIDQYISSIHEIIYIGKEHYHTCADIKKHKATCKAPWDRIAA